MKHKFDLDKLNLLQATGLILGIILTVLILWTTAIWATSPISQNSARYLKTISIILEQAWYILIYDIVVLILISFFLALLILLKIFKKNKINSIIKDEFNESDKIPIEYRNMIFDKFNEIITEIETSHLPAGDIIRNHFAETDELERIIINKSSEKYSNEFSKLYNQYKKPRNETIWSDIWTYPYNLDSNKFAKHPEYHINGVNNGEEFAKYNIQKIFDFLK